MKKISVLIFLVGFLLFRPYQMDAGRMMYSGDDYSYFAHASSISYGQFPSYRKEFYMNDGDCPAHSIGPGLMASPFVYLFSWLDRFMESSIALQRDPGNIPQSWSVYGFVLSSVFYLWLGCFLLYRGLRHHFKEYETVLAVFLIVLCQGIPLFAFRRPVFSHISEFCMISTLVWFLLLPQEEWHVWGRKYISAVVVGAITGLLVLIRLNNVAMLVVWPVLLFAIRVTRQDRAGAWKKILLSYIFAGGLVAAFQVLPDIVYHNTSNNSVIKDLLLNFHAPLFYFQRLWHILTGIDWGLIYTAPFILIGLLGAVFFKYPLRRAILFSMLPLLVNLYVVITWKTQGGWYGYRYLIPAAAPLCVYPLALVLNRASDRFGRGVVLIVSLALCTLPLLSMLAFEGNPKELTLQVVKQYFGDSGWGNNTYQKNIWTMLVKDPSALFTAIFKGGPLYLLICIMMVFNISSPAVIAMKGIYLSFYPVLLVRALGIYLLPFILTYISERIPDRNVK